MAYSKLPRIEWRIGDISDLPDRPSSYQAGLWAITETEGGFFYELYVATQNGDWEVIRPFVHEPEASFNVGFSSGFRTRPPILSSQVGIIKLYAGTAPPEGYLLCDGSTVPRSGYENLVNFAIAQGNIGAGMLFGDGDGVTSFSVPNLSAIAPPNTVYIIKY